MKNYIIVFFFFNALTAHDVPLGQPSEATAPSRVPSLTLLSAAYIAKNVAAYKDALIASNNRDIINLVIQCAPLYKIAQRLTLTPSPRGCSIDHVQITADRIVTIRPYDIFIHRQDGTLIPTHYKYYPAYNSGPRFPGDRQEDARRSRYSSQILYVSDSIHSMISPCGNYLMTVNNREMCWSSEILIFDLKTGKHLRKFEVAAGKNSILVNTKYITLKANRDLVHLIALDSMHDDNPKECYKALLHKEPIKHLVTSADGNRIATVTDDNAIHLWNDTGMGCGTCIKKIKLNEACDDIAFSSDGTQFACTAGNTLLLFDAAGKQLHNFGIRTWPWQRVDYSQKVFLKLFFSQDNKRLIASSTIDNKQYFITIFDIATKKTIADLEGTGSCFGHGLRQWHDKIIATNDTSRTVYTDEATKLFDIPKYLLQLEQDIQIVDDHTLLLRNKDQSYTVRTDTGICQQFPDYYKAPAASSTGSKLAFLTGLDDVDVYERLPENDVTALNELVKCANKS